MDGRHDIPLSFRERLGSDKRMLALAAAGALLVLVIAGAAFTRCSAAKDGVEPIAEGPGIGQLPIAGDPAETRTPDATGAAEQGQASGSGDSSGSDSGQATDGRGAGGQGDVSGGTSAPVAPLMAYRLDGSLWVAREDGTDPAEVAPYREGPFSLSPDGTMLAVASGGVMVIVRVETGAVTTIGPAEHTRPAWASDSSAVLYVRGAPDAGGTQEVWRVPASGIGARRVLQGHAPRVAHDGTVVALPASAGTGSAGASGFVWIVRPSSMPVRVSTPGAVTSADVSGGRVVYATVASEGDAGGPAIWSVRFDGSDTRRIAQAPAADRPFGYTDVCLSPDGTHVMATMTGDDGYSRTQIVCMGTGRVTQLSVRRDTYPIGWSSDGTGVLFVEGNAFQGEPTAVLGASRDGTGRRVLVERAGLW